MSERKTVTLKCSKCGNLHNTEAYSSINVGESPELKEAVCNGSAFTWECPHCGSLNLIQSPVLYHDPGRSLMIWLCGPQPLPEDRIKSLFATDESLKTYTARLVDSIGDLIEKVKIFDAELDDMGMEMCKYVTRMELIGNCSDPARKEAIRTAPIKFLRIDGADSDITLAYPLDSQMQMVNVGFNVYEDCLGILRRNPSIKEEATGLVRIDAGWLSRYFR